MAVQNKWVNSDVEAGGRAKASQIMPGAVYGFAVTFEVAAADDDTSIFKLARINANMIPIDIKINCDAMTGSTSWDLGFYYEDGVVADANILMAAADLNAGKALGSEQNGLADLGVANIGKRVYELLGLTAVNKKEGYILALTANTIGSAAGTVSVRGLFLQG